MKKVTLECFTNNSGIHEMFPISPARKFRPEWFEHISSAFKTTNEFGVEHEAPTLKRCDGLIKLYNNGWILPLWADFIIETEADGRYRWITPHGAVRSQVHDADESTLDSHYPEQMGNMFDDYVHIKLIVPWYIREKTGVDFHFGGNTWGIKQHWDDIIILPGILNFKSQHGANINMFMKKERRIELKHNTPLIQCIPLSKARLEIKNILATDQEYKHLKQYAYGFTFTGLYKKRLKLKNERK